MAGSGRVVFVVLSGALTALTLASCAFDWDFPGDSSGSDGGLVDALASDASDAGKIDAMVAEAGQPCQMAAECSMASPAQVCHYDDFSCGRDGGSGTCTDAPTACSTTDHVCGCDGKIYTSECAAGAAGEDLSKGGCSIDGQTEFTCGTHVCTQNTQYCKVGAGPTYECVTVPVMADSCTPLTCSCSEILGLMCTCSGSPGEVRLTNCP